MAAKEPSASSPEGRALEAAVERLDNLVDVTGAFASKGMSSSVLPAGVRAGEEAVAPRALRAPRELPNQSLNLDMVS